MIHWKRLYPPGIAHIAFEVDNVEATLKEIIIAGGSSVGELVTAPYPDGMEAVFVYAKDPEGNIIELQSWRKVADWTHALTGSMIGL